MGVWGAGNFDGDSPRDFLADMVGRWEQLVEKVLAGDTPEEAVALGFARGLDAYKACLMPTVEIIITAAEQLKPDYLPALETVEWRSQYLTLFDREVGSCDPSPEFKAERQGVIETTFARLMNIIRSRSGR